MRRAAKTDGNHAATRDHLRSSGWSVHDTSAVHGGFGDLVVSRLGHTAIVEVKDGRGDLNELQRRFRDGWQGAYFVVRSPEDAIKQLSLWLLALTKFTKP